MPKPAVEVKGLREFRRDLKQLDVDADKELRKELKVAGETALHGADVPTRSGALARSLKISVTAKRITLYSTLPYAGVVHWGGTIEPRGVPIRFPRTEFLSKAVDQGAAQAEQNVADAVDRAARRAGWH